MADDEQFSLCWNNFNSNLSAGFHESLCRGDLVDVTLAAEGQFVKAHRLVLSVCSPYFRKMFTQMPANQHAFVFLKDVSHTALKDLIQFMYCGEVNVKQDALPAFISTAEALQIKGLTDGDPAPSQSPAKPSTPAPQPAQQTMTSPRVKQRNSTTRSYKIESVEDSGDDKPTQIVLQTTAAPQPQSTLVQQTTTVSQKRPAAQRSISTPHTKRMKSTDPLEASEPTQQIAVQTVAESKSNEPEFIDLPIELPTKSEPEYAEDAGEVETTEQETSYVEDDSYGDMKYDESYFTENEEATTTAGPGAGATTSATIKQSTTGSFSESYVTDAGDQSATEAQDCGIRFIRSQKKNAQLVYKGYIYNKKLTQANGHTTWRCADVLKLKCKAVVITKQNRLIAARRQHNHTNHLSRIGSRPLYEVEEELGEYIEIKADDPKLAEMIQVSHIEVNKDQFKIFVPASSSTTLTNTYDSCNRKLEQMMQEISKN